MSFAAPLLLLALVLVPLAAAGYVWIERQRDARAAEWATPALVPNLVKRPSRRTRHIPAALFLLGLTFLCLGIARPQAKLNTVREGATIVLALDKSGSMAAKDVKPTRILAARAAVFAMLQKLPSKYRVSLVTFSDHPAVVVPPTYDRHKVEEALPLKAIPQGTDIGDAVQTSVIVAVKTVGAGKGAHPPATVVLLSDGSQTVKGLSPAVAAKDAKKRNVPISTVLIGTAKGSVDQTVPYQGYKEKKTVPVPVDATDLALVAKTSGGRFYHALNAQQLIQVYRDLGSHAAHQHKKREVTAAAVGLALAFILAGIAISGIWFRRFA